MSRQSAWEDYTLPARQMLVRPGTPDEAEAMPVAVEEVAHVRRCRRAHRS